MVLQKLIDYLFRNSKEWKSATQQLQYQQESIQKLQESLNTLDPSSKENILKSPTIIEHIHVDTVIIEQYEQSNNFGALGIKTLEGRLNIGANYGTTDPLTEKQKRDKARFIKEKNNIKKQPQQPKTTIRSRST